MGHGHPATLHTCPQSPSKQMGQAALGAKEDPEENLGEQLRPPRLPGPC